MALEMMSGAGSRRTYISITLPELPWTEGRRTDASDRSDQGRDRSCRYGNPHLFEKFQHATPKGFLFMAALVRQKTLIGKATALQFDAQLREKNEQR